MYNIWEMYQPKFPCGYYVTQFWVLSWTRFLVTGVSMQLRSKSNLSFNFTYSDRLGLVFKEPRMLRILSA